MPHRFLIIFLATPALAIPASTTLTLVQGEPDFNVLTVTVDPDTPIPLPDTDTTVLTGTVIADLDIDPDTGRTSEFTLRDGRANTTEMRFSRSFIVGYDITTKDLSASVATTDPPGLIDQLSGEFDASQHSFKIDAGTISGTALGNAVSLSIPPSDPFLGSGSGTGKVTLSAASSSGIYRQFTVVVTLPINVADRFDADGVAVDLRASGTLKATGSIQVPESEYLAWTIAQGIAGAEGQDDSNGDGVPNAITWALGLGADDDAHDHLLRPAEGGFEIQLPSKGTVAPITILGSNLSLPWSPIPPNRLSNAINPIPPGSTGRISITRAEGEFLRMGVSE